MGIPYAEVIGDPIVHSKSPLIHKFWLEKVGIAADYRATRVRASELAGYVRSRRADPLWRGSNVTMPHKTAIVQFVDQMEREAREAGTANCVLPRLGRLVAKTTDAFGVKAGIRRAVDAACVIGCGGAARAAVATLEVLATKDVRLIVRDLAKGSALLKEFGYEPKVSSFDDAEKTMRRTDCVINATPLGMEGYPPIPAQVLLGLSGTARDAFVFDMVYSPVATELLLRAKSLRRETIDGLVMLIGQAAAAFRLFFAAEAPRQHDAELRHLLTS